MLLYASECWAPTVENMNKLQRNDRAMIRWICNVRLKDRVSSTSLLEKLRITDIKSAIRYNRLRWYGHVQRDKGCISHVANMVVEGKQTRGRPRKNWSNTVQHDLEDWNLTPVDPMDRGLWRKLLKVRQIAVQPP